MTDQELVNFKLDLAKAWLNNGQEQMARDMIRSIIEKAEGNKE
jgi:Tfp pilus assembly protein FimV